MRELTRTEEILWNMLISFSAQSLKGKVPEEQIAEIVERAANEIKGKIPVYREENVAEKLKEWK